MTIAGSLSAIFVNRMLVGYGGDLAVSAYGVINRLMMFALMPGMVIGQGLQPILGFNYGAKRYGRGLKAIKIAIAVATACNLVAFMFLYFTPETFIGIFTTDSELITVAAYAAKRIWLVLYLVGSMMVGSIVFQAMGKAVQSFITAISRPALFLLPLIFILPHFLQIEGVWLAFPVTDILTFLLTLILLIPQILELKRAERRAGSEPAPAISGQVGTIKRRNISTMRNSGNSLISTDNQTPRIFHS
jgi:Na+-driven multidrug efflux pump